jgi:predicted nucleic acid-binding protein
MSAASYVVDASVALKWFVRDREEDVERAIQLICDCQLKTTTLCLFEIGNTLGRIAGGEPEKVASALDEVEAICGEPVGLIRADHLRCASLMDEHSLTFYDASYVAIAERLGRRVVSADRDLIEPGLAVDLAGALAGS